jgi:hypothetical protein
VVPESESAGALQHSPEALRPLDRFPPRIPKKIINNRAMVWIAGGLVNGVRLRPGFWSGIYITVGVGIRIFVAGFRAGIRLGIYDLTGFCFGWELCA